MFEVQNLLLAPVAAFVAGDTMTVVPGKDTQLLPVEVAVVDQLPALPQTLDVPV